MKTQNKTQRTVLSIAGLRALLAFLEGLDRRDVEAVYLQSKKILTAGRSKIIEE